MKRLLTLITFAFALSFAAASTAEASRWASSNELKTFQRVLLKHEKARPWAFNFDRIRGRQLSAVRSEVSSGWAIAQISDPFGNNVRHAVVLTKQRGRWGVRNIDTNSNFSPTEKFFCRKGAKATAIGIDLGYAGFGLGGKSGPCRQSKTLKKLQRPMTAGELASVRANLEPHNVLDQDGNIVDRVQSRPPVWRSTDHYFPDCEWDGKDGYPQGVVSRSDRRWGAVTLRCIGDRLVVFVVGRNGKSGAFTKSIAEHEQQFLPFLMTCTKPKLPKALRARARAEIGACPGHVSGTSRTRKIR